MHLLHRFGTITLLASLLLPPTGLPARDASEGEGYIPTVWWSQRFGIKQISQADAFLTAPFEDAIPEARNGVRGEAINCRSLLALRESGFEPQGDWGYAQERFQGARCLAVTMLRGAKPARKTFLKCFNLTSAAVRALPPTVAASFSQLDYDAATKAESEGKTLKDFAPSVMGRAEKDGLLLYTETWQVHLQLYGRADFDGDGIEDVLLAVNECATGGSYDNTKLLLISKTTSDGRLVTLRRLQ